MKYSGLHLLRLLLDISAVAMWSWPGNHEWCSDECNPWIVIFMNSFVDLTEKNLILKTYMKTYENLSKIQGFSEYIENYRIRFYHQPLGSCFGFENLGPPCNTALRVLRVIGTWEVSSLELFALGKWRVCKSIIILQILIVTIVYIPKTWAIEKADMFMFSWIRMLKLTSPPLVPCAEANAAHFATVWPLHSMRWQQ